MLPSITVDKFKNRVYGTKSMQNWRSVFKEEQRRSWLHGHSTAPVSGVRRHPATQHSTSDNINISNYYVRKKTSYLEVCRWIHERLGRKPTQQIKRIGVSGQTDISTSATILNKRCRANIQHDVLIKVKDGVLMVQTDSMSPSVMSHDLLVAPVYIIIVSAGT